MNLTALSNDQLISSTKKLCQEERELTLKVLHHLKEIEKRSLFLKFDCSNLIDYCIKEFKYSETSAYRRVQAMKLLKEVPHIAQKIESGSLNLNQLSQAQTFFQKSKKELKVVKTHIEKVQILKSIENKSKRETERTLFSIEPEISLKPKESLRLISSTASELKVTVSEKTSEHLDMLKRHFGGRKSFSEIIEILVSQKIEDLSKQRKRLERKDQISKPNLKPKPMACDGNQIAKTKSHQNNQKEVRIAAPPVKLISHPPEKIQRSRHIPNDLKRLVMNRANHTCEYKSPITSNRCSSQLYLEFDHIQEYGKGGKHTFENLQVLCWQHHNMKTKGNL